MDNKDTETNDTSVSKAIKPGKENDTNAGIRIKRLAGGLFMSNCYIISAGDACAVVDPGVEPGKILKSVESLQSDSDNASASVSIKYTASDIASYSDTTSGSTSTSTSTSVSAFDNKNDKNEKNDRLKVQYIILTHSHIDHILYMDELREITGAPVLIHSAEADCTANRWMNGAAIFGVDKQNGRPDRTVKDGEVLKLGASGLLEIIHTPGHSPGGICIKVGNAVMTGDTLFQSSIGRTDIGNGDINTLLDSIRNKLFTLSEDTVVYPGHGATTTIGREIAGNPYV